MSDIRGDWSTWAQYNKIAAYPYKFWEGSTPGMVLNILASSSLKENLEEEKKSFFARQRKGLHLLYTL